MASVRLTDLLAGLSRLADLGFGLHAGEALRSSAIAVTLARSLDLPDDDVRAAMHTALLLHVGCTGPAHESARVFGDDHALNLAAEQTNLADPRDVVKTFLPELTRGRPPSERARLALTSFTRGRRHGIATATAACEVGRDAARRLRLPAESQHSIYYAYEWWNGDGVPDGLVGEDIPVGARLALLSSTAALFDTLGGTEVAVEAVRRRAGGLLDPLLVREFARRAGDILAEVGATDPKDLVLGAEPPPLAWVADAGLVEVAAVFGDLADLKTPYTHGHSRAVAALARGAGERLALPDLDALETAALLHDVGRVAISNAIWDKPEALNAHEWEQVRLHAYHSERILAGSDRLAAHTQVLGMHHERLDGSGYHRGCRGADLTMPARVLAAADAYQAMTQRRPYRPAFDPEVAAQRLREDARSGRLDEDAVAAVLTAAGHRSVVTRREAPAGLTSREVEVLRLVAEGRSNPDIAEHLVISRRTAEQHVQNIYRKIGASTRAAAALFAMEHDLIPH